MQFGSSMEMAMQALVPSWGELNISLAAAILCLICLSLWGHSGELLGAKTAFRWLRPIGQGFRKRKFELECHKLVIGSVDEIEATGSDSGSYYKYLVRVELLAAKNLTAANINGTSDPYAIVICGSKKRFSSMVPGTRNPVWGEEFEFLVDELPIEVHVMIYDWAIIMKSTKLGSTTCKIEKECQSEALWHALEGGDGQVCIKLMTKKRSSNAARTGDILERTFAQKRLQDKPSGIEVQQKLGPLQTIFDLPPHEVVEHKFSCALERSFLYHGRMYVSSWHICFHSNVFAKQLKVVLPFQYVEEIKKSQHALINPAITIILRAGTGGIGVPPLASTDGRVKYKFASFWNRNHALRVLQRAADNFEKLEEEAKQRLLRVRSTSLPSTGALSHLPLVSAADGSEKQDDTKIVQPFIEEEVLDEILNDIELPCSAEQFYFKLLSDDSNFFENYHAARSDRDLKLEKWHTVDQFSGLIRRVTFRSLCHNPMCPPDTAMTETQHVFFQNNKGLLILETIQQAHDVPFGSAFEVHARWTHETISESTCTVRVEMGTHFKKRVFMASKIKVGAEAEYKVDALLYLDFVQKEFEQDKPKINLDYTEEGISQEDHHTATQN